MLIRSGASGGREIPLPLPRHDKAELDKAVASVKAAFKQLDSSESRLDRQVARTKERLLTQILGVHHSTFTTAAAAAAAAAEASHSARRKSFLVRGGNRQHPSMGHPGPSSGSGAAAAPQSGGTALGSSGIKTNADKIARGISGTSLTSGGDSSDDGDSDDSGLSDGEVQTFAELGFSELEGLGHRRGMPVDTKIPAGVGLSPGTMMASTTTMAAAQLHEHQQQQQQQQHQRHSNIHTSESRWRDLRNSLRHASKEEEPASARKSMTGEGTTRALRKTVTGVNFCDADSDASAHQGRMEEMARDTLEKAGGGGGDGGEFKHDGGIFPSPRAATPRVQLRVAANRPFSASRAQRWGGASGAAIGRPRTPNKLNRPTTASARRQVSAVKPAFGEEEDGWPQDQANAPGQGPVFYQLQNPVQLAEHQQQFTENNKQRLHVGQPHTPQPPQHPHPCRGRSNRRGKSGSSCGSELAKKLRPNSAFTSAQRRPLLRRPFLGSNCQPASASGQEAAKLSNQGAPTMTWEPQARWMLVEDVASGEAG